MKNLTEVWRAHNFCRDIVCPQAHSGCTYIVVYSIFMQLERKLITNNALEVLKATLLAAEFATNWHFGFIDNFSNNNNYIL